MAVDDDGCFTERITDFSGRYIKEAEKDIIQAVKASVVDIFTKDGKLLQNQAFVNFIFTCSG